jgi:hypothetical protein
VNDPDFKPRELPPVPSVLRPIFAVLAGAAVLFGIGILVWAFVAAPHGIPVK